jgi:hypothetical protein
MRRVLLLDLLLSVVLPLNEEFSLRENSIGRLSFIPLPNWHNQVQLGVVWQMRDVGHSIRWITIQFLKIVLMGTDDHHVRTDVELMVRGPIFRLPRAEIHVRDADAINLRRSAGEAILYPAQEYRVEARWLVVRISRNRW